MLSILIPTYNYACASLVSDLHLQAVRLNIDFEILVADDCSQEYYKEKNRAINKLSQCKYVELKENIGRSKIRNLLGRMAKYDYLLFMDCDAEVVHRDFLKRYLEVLSKGRVIYGGLLHPDKLPSQDVTLAYKYEKNAEPKNTYDKRAVNPYKVFRTFNFMIERKTFLEHQFDESITRYGHEDTLFGKRLQQDDIEIVHIDNPLLNCGLDTNVKVLEKTRESLQGLYELRYKIGDSSGVLRMYNMLDKLKLTTIFRSVFKCFSKAILSNLQGRHPKLFLFSFYKIGYYCQICNEKKKTSDN